VVRKHLRGEEEKHLPTSLMWRSLIPAERLEGLNLEERGNYWFGPGPDPDHLLGAAEKPLQHLGSVPAPEVQRESWDDSGDISEMLSLVRRRRAARPPDARAVPERLYHRHVLSRSNRQLDKRPHHAARATPRIRW